jgi:hypothetical protein
MKRTRFTDEQIIGILAGHEAGAKCADLCRKHGMSEVSVRCGRSDGRNPRLIVSTIDSGHFEALHGG